MTTEHPIRVADAAASVHLDPTNLDALVKREVWVLDVGESLGDITQSSGSIFLAVASAATGQLYLYDATDSTTADDGVTCLVDASGHRYFLQDSASIKISSVLAVQNDPPGSPSDGDAYVVDTVPTGDWSGQAGHVALYTRRGWVFAIPEIGTTLLDQATGLNVQYAADGTWGPFAGSNADASVRPRALEWQLGLAVESTLNTPPGSPTVELYYIVGAAPTGAWSGKSGKVATYYNSAWEFIDPYEGAQVFNRALGYELFYVSGAWTGPAVSDLQQFDTPGTTTWTKPAIGKMAHIEVWGAGGSGSRIDNSETPGGAGGGAYDDAWIPLADLTATETVIVGAGGASKTTPGDGNVGGDSSFAGLVKAFGGGGGSHGSGPNGGGGGGGGPGSAGATGSGSSGGAGGNDLAGKTTGDDSGGAGGTNDKGESSRRGGGGGGDGVHNGGASGWGGGGGSGGSASPSGGLSRYGGNGGTATAGAQPGGGGAGAKNGNSGKGGDGRVRVTVF